MNKLVTIVLGIILLTSPSVLVSAGVPADSLRELAMALLVAMFLQPWVVHHLE